MNRTDLSKQLAIGLKQARIEPGRNYLNNQLYATLLGIAPISIDDSSLAYIKNAYQYNPDVYSIINGITRAASSVPAVVLEVVDEKAAREFYRVKHATRNGMDAGTIDRVDKLRKKAFVEVDPMDDLARLIERPNPLQSWSDFIENSMGFMEITGNSYTHGTMLSDGRFGELWIMPPQYTEIIANKSSETLITGYNLMLYGYKQPIPVETVLHMKYWNPDYSYAGSHLYGMSPLMSARRTVRASNDNIEALSKALQNNGASGMIFPDDPDLTTLSESQRSDIQRFFDTNKSGADRYKSVLATTAKMGWTPFGMSPIDLEIIESKKMSMRDLCNIYGYPSEMMNDPDNKTNSNKKESRKQLYQDCVVPKLERFYSELNRFVVPRFERVTGKKYHIDYDTSSIEALQEDISEKVEWLSKAWWIAPNRKAEEMNFEPNDNPIFDEPFIPTGLVPLSDLSMLGELTDEEAKLLQREYGGK
jgi:HK97 family phage portal protein